MAEISHPSPSEYCFQYAELSSKKCMSVKEIPESSEEGDFVSVIGKIANISDTSTVGTRNLKMVEAILLDTTGKIKISMFEENIASVRQGSIYKILNSRVRCWNGAKKLTTTPTSIISQTEDETLKEMAIEDVLTEENDESTLVVPFIKSVEKVEVYSVCLQCSKKLLQATASLIVKCDRCKHSMILSNCQKRISVHFTVESQDVTTLTVFENILRSVIPEMGEISEEELIERLLLLNNVRITYNSVTLIVSCIEV